MNTNKVLGSTHFLSKKGSFMNWPTLLQVLWMPSRMNAIFFILQVFINTLDSATVKKLCIWSLRRGIGSMDYIDPLLIMEDDLDNANGDDNDDSDADVYSPAAEASGAIQPPPLIPQQRQGPVPEWCVCGNCRNMPLKVEKVCCRKKKIVMPKNQDSKNCVWTLIIWNCQ